MTTNEQPITDNLNTQPAAGTDLEVTTASSVEIATLDPPEEEKAKMMDLVGHLGELRSRLIISILSFAVASLIGWFLATPFLQYLSVETGRSFVFIAPGEAFMSLLKVSMSIGLVLSSPILLTELWMFVMPGLMPREVFFFRRYVPFVIALFLVGLIFAHFAVYPIALRFFLGFGTETLQAKLAVGRYLSFFLTMHLPFGVMFELPVVIISLVRAGLLNVGFLIKQHKMAYLLAFVVGAIFTPPDPVSQILMALPLVLLFELSLFLAKRISPVRDEEIKMMVSGGEDQ